MLIVDLGVDLLLENDVLRQFGQVTLDYGDTPALGGIVIDARKGKNWKGQALCSVATQIPACVAALVPVSASGAHDSPVMIEASRGLEDQKGVTIGRAMLPAWTPKDLRVPFSVLHCFVCAIVSG